MRAAAVALVCVAVAAGPAHAQDSEVAREAKADYETGIELARAGDYVTAIIAFEQSLARHPRPNTLYNLALAYLANYRAGGPATDLKAALDAFERYVRDYPKGKKRTFAGEMITELTPLWNAAQEAMTEPAPADNKLTQITVRSSTPGAIALVDLGYPAEVPITRTVEPGEHEITVSAHGFLTDTITVVAREGQLVSVPVELQPLPAFIEVRAPAGATISVDGRTMGTAPLDTPIEVAAGRYIVAVTKPGYRPFSTTVMLGSGEVADIETSLERSSQRRLAKVGFYVSGATLLAALVPAFVAHSAQGDAEAIRDIVAGGGNLTEDQIDEHNAALDRRDRYRSTAYTVLGIGTGLGIASLLLYWLDDPHPEKASQRLRVSPALESDFTGAFISGGW